MIASLPQHAPLLSASDRTDHAIKAALLTYSVSRADGGIFEVTRRIAQSLLEQAGVSVEVFGLEDSFTAADLPQWRPIQPRTFRHRGPRLCGYAPGLRRALHESDANVLHIHGIWSYYTLAGYDWGRTLNRPYVLTVHGMLSPFALNIGRWKKAVAEIVFKNTVLRSANCLQAFTTRELQEIRRYGLRNPVCVIPNGVDLPQREPGGAPPWKDHVKPGRKVLLYLGRLHPIKGLPNLLRAWELFQRGHSPQATQWDLVIAGWSQNGHEAELKSQAAAAGCSNSVHFIGPQFGAGKLAAYHFADGFVLPSLSEGLPTVVLEAWACGRPVLMTTECGLTEGVEAGAAFMANTTPEALAEGIARLSSMTDVQRREMGRRGRDLVAERFTWPKVARQMRSVYEWLRNGGEAPGCVKFF